MLKTPTVLIPLPDIEPAAPVRIYTDFILMFFPDFSYEFVHVKMLFLRDGLKYLRFKNIRPGIDEEVYLRLFMSEPSFMLSTPYGTVISL